MNDGMPIVALVFVVWILLPPRYDPVCWLEDWLMNRFGGGDK